MNLLKYSIKLSLIVFISSAFAQKKSIDHTDFKSWNNLDATIISNDGNWVSYEINPQDGDGILVITNKENSFTKRIRRGYNARFSPSNDFIAFKIKAQKDLIRKEKFAKKAKDELPKDSLGIFILNTNSLLSIPNIKSYKVAKEESAWIAYLKEKEFDIKTLGNTLVIFNPISSQKFEYPNVLEYRMSKNGKIIGIISATNDSIKHCKVSVFEIVTQQFLEIFRKEGECKEIICDNNGDQLAFIHSSDSIINKTYNLYYWNNNLNQAKLTIKKDNKGILKGWCINKNTYNYFSEDGSKLFFETAPIIKEQSKDTLLDEEKISLDIWNWKDELLQPQQKAELKSEKKRTYQAVYHIKKDKVIQLCDKSIKYISHPSKGNGIYALGKTTEPYSELLSWKFNDQNAFDFHLINLNTGVRKKIITKLRKHVYISPYENYVVYYNHNDSIWYSYSIKKDMATAITKNIPVNFYDEQFDDPVSPTPYGIAGWAKNEKSVLLYDLYDIWKIDLENKEKPINITSGVGRKKDIQFRYVKLDLRNIGIATNKNILLSGFNLKTKQKGFFSLNINNTTEPVQLIYDNYNFTKPIKAKNASTLIWKKESFVEFGDLWLSDINFNNTKKISDVNPQQKDYLWGTVDLVEWTSYDDINLQGMFYRPEKLDPAKKYPMIVYFYERRSNRLHRHYIPSPSENSINITNYVSNGYIVFVPDIVYKKGYPGQSAYNAIISGTNALLKKYDFIDSNKLGLQGWSWGAYQTAYLITQTNLFSAAMASALVSNMTSAYGGIRWNTGKSRMFQYESGQSRIGNTLWEKTNLYIENSPLFYTPKINTPLLMMHNDEDGSVPWYQSIELFVGLQRLNKPVWMLVYNEEGHSIDRRPNKIDFEIRMMQFFDHYLNGKPIPIWMKEGIPAIKKGKEFGYELE